MPKRTFESTCDDASVVVVGRDCPTVSWLLDLPPEVIVLIARRCGLAGYNALLRTCWQLADLLGDPMCARAMADLYSDVVVEGMRTFSVLPNRRLHGPETIAREKGGCVYIPWSLGRIDGEVVDRRADGKLRRRSTWKAGVLDGEQEDFFHDGKSKQHVTWDTTPGAVSEHTFNRQSGETIVTRWIDGKVQGIRDVGVEYQHWKDGYLHGESASDRNRFSATLHRNYKHGLMHGMQRTYDPFRLSICNYEFGVLSGTFAEFSLAHRRLVTGSYKNGLQHGIQREWNDGKLIAQTECKHGLQHGVTLRWTVAGVLLERTKWRHGELHGSQRMWTADGELSFKQSYCNGNELWSLHLCRSGPEPVVVMRDPSQRKGWLQTGQLVFHVFDNRVIFLHPVFNFLCKCQLPYTSSGVCSRAGGKKTIDISAMETASIGTPRPMHVITMYTSQMLCRDHATSLPFW